MRKVIYSLAMMTALSLMASPCFAGFTLFDTAKDAMFIGRGEFTSLERTNKGDRLVFRCDSAIKGSISGEVTLEPFEVAPADEALGREAIVGFDLINGKYYFSATNQRRGVFMKEEGIDHCEKALTALIAINAPHQPMIEAELRKRLEYQNMAYEGEFPQELLDSWKSELVRQCKLHGSAAARDAAKCLLEHGLFKGKVTLSDMQLIAPEVPLTPAGSTERSFMILVIRNENSVHPGFETLLTMLKEETADFNVGRLAELFNAKDHGAVFAAMDTIVKDTDATEQHQVNALQVLQAFRQVSTLPTVHYALKKQQDAGVEGMRKNVARRALMAMRDTPDTSSVAALESFLGSEICGAKFEFEKRALQALAMIDTDQTNAMIRAKFIASKDSPARRQFLRGLLSENKDWRGAIMIHNED